MRAFEIVAGARIVCKQYYLVADNIEKNKKTIKTVILNENAISDNVFSSAIVYQKNTISILL